MLQLYSGRKEYKRKTLMHVGPDVANHTNDLSKFECEKRLQLFVVV